MITVVQDLRIIADNLWEQVRHRQGALTSKNTAVPVWDRHHPKFLLARLITCNCCGGGYTIKGKDRYGCHSNKSKGPAICGNSKTIARQKLEARVLTRLKAGRSNPAASGRTFRSRGAKNAVRSEHTRCGRS